MTPEELVATTAPQINRLGAVYYFHPDTLAHGKDELGLDGMRFYVLGRGGVLGNVSAPVITAAFGYFAPAVIDKVWNSAREHVEPATAAAAALACNAKLGRDALADVDELASFCAAAEHVLDNVNPAGLQLYAGIAGEPLPEDLPGRAMQLLVCHRELRGSAHLCAVIAAGVHPAAAHAIRRPNDLAMFGWPEDFATTDEDRANLQTADAATDAMSAQHYASLSDDQRTAFVQGVQAIASALL